jgi:transposase InsO family protein
VRIDFIHQHREEWPVTVLCKVMRVNRSYYYEFIKNEQNQIDEELETLKIRLPVLFETHKQNYGSRRLMRALWAEGFKIGRYRVRKLMKSLGLLVKQKLRYKNTTDSSHDWQVAENLLDRNFQPEKPNQVWTTDITYIWTAQGWLYLAIVVDLFSRKIIGWATQDHMRTALCKEALLMAWWRRKRPEKVMHHSDRGSQYASIEYRQLLADVGMTQSMSRKGNCWDNSPTERVFRTLKSEWLNRFGFKTRAEAKAAAWDYISYYNVDRIHSTLGYVSPVQFELKWKVSL